MPQQPWIIVNDETHLYLIGYNQDPQLCVWGNEENAITWEQEQDAQNIANGFQSGFIHPVRKNPH